VSKNLIYDVVIIMAFVILGENRKVYKCRDGKSLKETKYSDVSHIVDECFVYEGQFHEVRGGVKIAKYHKTNNVSEVISCHAIVMNGIVHLQIRDKWIPFEQISENALVISAEDFLILDGSDLYVVDGSNLLFLFGNVKQVIAYIHDTYILTYNNDLYKYGTSEKICSNVSQIFDAFNLVYSTTDGMLYLGGLSSDAIHMPNVVEYTEYYKKYILLESGQVLQYSLDNKFKKICELPEIREILHITSWDSGTTYFAAINYDNRLWIDGELVPDFRAFYQNPQYPKSARS
jgi:hypothetical protein